MDFQTIVFLLLSIIVGARAQCPADRTSLPNADSCGTYYNCSTGQKVLENCPPGMYYNCMTQSCGEKTFEVCCYSLNKSIYFPYTKEGGISFPCLNGTVAKTPGFYGFAACVGGTRILLGSCPVGFEFCEASKSCYFPNNETCTSGSTYTRTMPPFSVTSGSWVSAAPWEFCPNDSNFGDLKNCSVYYNCSSGVPNLFKCPEGYLYDCFNDVCSNMSHTTCCYNDPVRNSSSTRINEQFVNTTMYNCKNGRYVELDLLNCSFECVNNNLLFGFCGMNLSYCNLTNSCYNASTTNCSRTARQNISSPSPPTTESIASICFNSSVTGVYGDCTKYFYFNSSGSYTIPCKDGLYFNSFKKCCLSPSQIFTPACSGNITWPPSDSTCTRPYQNVENLQTCDSYYTCSSMFQIQAKTCPSGELFDWKQATCTSAFSATVVPGCTTTKYNKCINSNNARGQFCKFLTWAPSFLSKNLGENLKNLCKGVICTMTSFI